MNPVDEAIGRLASRIRRERASRLTKIALAVAAVAAVAIMAFAVSLNIAVTRAIASIAPTSHTAFVIAIDTYPLEYGGEAYIVRYTLDGAYHAPDFRRHEDVGTFLEHLKTIAAVDGLLDL